MAKKTLTVLGQQMGLINNLFKKIRRPIIAKTILILSIISIISLLTGCTAYEKAKDKVLNRNPETTENTTTEECPPCEDPFIKEPDKVIYMFDKHSEGLINFLTYADLIYCTFPVLEDSQIAQTITTAKKNNKEVKIIMDKSASFTDCDKVCLPRQNSQYNYFISENIDVKIKNIKERYCITNDGIFFYSGNFDKNGVDESHAFYSNTLAEIYKKQFLKRYQT